MRDALVEEVAFNSASLRQTRGVSDCMRDPSLAATLEILA